MPKIIVYHYSIRLHQFCLWKINTSGRKLMFVAIYCLATVWLDETLKRRHILIQIASFINIWDRLIWQRSPNLTRSSKLAAAPNWSLSTKAVTNSDSCFQTPRKLFMLYRTENQFFATFSNFKHGYIKKFYWSCHIFHWSSHFFILGLGPRTDKFRGVCVFWCPPWCQAISNLHWRDYIFSPESYCTTPGAWHWYKSLIKQWSW